MLKLLDHMQRHAQFSCRIIVLLAAAVLWVSFVGCRTASDALSTEASVVRGGDVLPCRLLLGWSGETNVTLQHRVVVDDVALVRVLFNTLRAPSTNRFRIYSLMAPRPFVFVDEQGEVVGAYRYWPAARPLHVFQPCTAQRIGDSYRVLGGRYGDVSVDNFDKKFKKYLDLWDPKIP